MIARIQAVTTLAMILAITFCAIRGWGSRNWGWAVPIFGLMIGHLSIVFAELLLQRTISRRRGEMSPGYVGSVCAAVRESVAAARAFCWNQPFRSGAQSNRFANPRNVRGVVLLHGFYCNRGVWNSWMRALGKASVPFIAVNLVPAFGSIDRYVTTIDQAIQDITEATGRTPILVGHSMGGIAARAWLAAFRGGTRVHRIVTIASPHGGTLLSRYSRITNTSQMSFGSAWLAALAANESPDRLARFTCFHSIYDNVVVPASSARLAGADNRLLARRAHLDMLDAPEIFAELLRLVESSETTN